LLVAEPLNPTVKYSLVSRIIDEGYFPCCQLARIACVQFEHVSIDLIVIVQCDLKNVFAWGDVAALAAMEQIPIAGKRD
jgi:hypothetical protein